MIHSTIDHYQLKLLITYFKQTCVINIILRSCEDQFIMLIQTLIMSLVDERVTKEYCTNKLKYEHVFLKTAFLRQQFTKIHTRISNKALL